MSASPPRAQPTVHLQGIDVSFVLTAHNEGKAFLQIGDSSRVLGDIGGTFGRILRERVREYAERLLCLLERVDGAKRRGQERRPSLAFAQLVPYP